MEEVALSYTHFAGSIIPAMLCAKPQSMANSKQSLLFLPCRMTYGNGLSSPAGSLKDIKPQAEIHLQVSTTQAPSHCHIFYIRLDADYNPACVTCRSPK